MRRAFLASAIALALVGAPGEAHAQCAPGSTATIGWTTGMAFVAGSAGALATASAAAELDDTRDFNFAVGLGAGIGASALLAGVYALVDSSTGCSMANDANPIVWSVPIVTFVVGAALPLALWGASDELSETEQMSQSLTAAAPRTFLFRHSWAF